MSDLKVIILAAGNGTRMKSSIPKVCHTVGGLSLIEHVIKTSDILNPLEIAVVVGEQSEEVIEKINSSKKLINCPVTIHKQKEQLGTGNAVLSAESIFDEFDGNILVLFADTPLITIEILNSLHNLQKEKNHSVVVLGMTPEDPNHYGRIIIDDNGNVLKIIEHIEASEEEKQVNICNSGVMLFKGLDAKNIISKIDNNNSKKEFYLTDAIYHANEQDLTVGLVVGDEESLLGVNSRLDLSEIEYIFQSRMRNKAMKNGVTLIDPESVYFSYDTEIEKDVCIMPNVTFGTKVKISSGSVIKPFCHIEGSIVCENSQIGPFAHLRPGSVIGKKVKIGNFVEVKKSKIDEGAKIGHLAYIGDSEIGKQTNIGAGTITCNYDGFTKSKTKIGENVFIGSNCSLVAPVDIGDRSIVGAGSVVTRKILPDALGYSRSPQQEIIGGATRYRRKRSIVKNVKNKKV